MGKKQKKQNTVKRKGLRAKLVIDDWFAERPLYRIKATTREKEKGIEMLELIEQNFNISSEDRKIFRENQLKELNADAMQPTVVPKSLRDGQAKFTRDSETGQIISPFESKTKPF